jgi:hypothetical protein
MAPGNALEPRPSALKPGISQRDPPSTPSSPYVFLAVPRPTESIRQLDSLLTEQADSVMTQGTYETFLS